MHSKVLILFIFFDALDFHDFLLQIEIHNFLSPTVIAQIEGISPKSWLNDCLTSFRKTSATLHMHPHLRAR